MRSQSRVQQGVPTGGQFAVESRPEAIVRVAPDYRTMTPAALDNERTRAQFELTQVQEQWRAAAERADASSTATADAQREYSQAVSASFTFGRKRRAEAALASARADQEAAAHARIVAEQAVNEVQARLRAITNAISAAAHAH